jgi:hypothetical protein
LRRSFSISGEVNAAPRGVRNTGAIKGQKAKQPYAIAIEARPFGLAGI